MSKYRVGQKLNVIVESIDASGKAKFRVLKESHLPKEEIFNRIIHFCDEENKRVDKKLADAIAQRDVSEKFLIIMCAAMCHRNGA